MLLLFHSKLIQNLFYLEAYATPQFDLVQVISYCYSTHGHLYVQVLLLIRYHQFSSHDLPTLAFIHF